MKRFCLLVLTVMTFGCIKEDEANELKVGDSLPEFTVQMNDGSIVSNGNLKGAVSVIMFFHTTCPDCQKALPVMQRIYDEFIPEGVEFVLISREEAESSISAFWSEKALNMPYSAQNDRSVYEKFAKSRIPRVYVNDRNGIIRHIYTDNPVPLYDDLKYSIEDAGAEQE